MPENRRTALICAALAVGTFLLYAVAGGFDFINLDDPIYVSTNVHLREGLSGRGLAWCFQTTTLGNWIPLTWLSYLLDYQWHGADPRGYHLTNIVLHAANAALLFLVLQRMTKACWRSAMAAALFAWHPTRVESVVWISERKDVLSGLFWILTMWAYVHYVSKPGAWRYALVLVLFALGLMAKPILVTLPFVLLVLDGWPLRRNEGGAVSARSWPRLVLEKVPMILLAAACGVVTVIAQGRSGAVSSLGRLPFLQRIGNALVSYCVYLEKAFWPVHLSVVYPLHQQRLAEIVAAVVFLAAITDRVLGLRKAHAYLTMGWLWFLGTLAPVIGLVQVGAQGMTDRYTYLAFIGLFIMFCWGLGDLESFLTRWHPWVAPALGGTVLILCVIGTRYQLQFWQNSGTLFHRSIELDSDNYVAHATYGIYLSEHGDTTNGIAELQKSVQIVPEFAYGHALLGKALNQAGQRDAAAGELRRAEDLDPGQIEARRDLASILLEQNQPAAAEVELAKVIQLDPDDPVAHALLGRALALQNKTTEAVAHYRIALRLQPAMVDALNNLAWILATDSNPANRDGAEAVRLARRACELTQNKVPMLIGTLAAAYAEAGDFDQAIATALKAHDLATAQGRAAVAAKNAQLLEFFRSHRAWRE